MAQAAAAAAMGVAQMAAMPRLTFSAAQAGIIFPVLVAARLEPELIRQVGMVHRAAVAAAVPGTPHSAAQAARVELEAPERIGTVRMEAEVVPVVRLIAVPQVRHRPEIMARYTGPEGRRGVVLLAALVLLAAMARLASSS